MRKVGLFILISCLLIMLGCESATKQEVIEEENEDKMDELLIQAAEEQDEVEVIRLIEEEGANIDTKSEEGETPVLIATKNNDADLVKQLIDLGADINIQDDREDNVLLYAGAYGYLDIVKLAIEADADTTIVNRYGGIALIPAAERGHLEVIEYLLRDSDSDVNHINDLGWTALLEAIILSDGGKVHQDIVQLLLDHGADMDIADRDGISPLDHAQKRGYDAITRILKQAKEKE